jgi:hypothetical protein
MLLALSPQVCLCSNQSFRYLLRLTLQQKIAESQLLGNLHIPDVLLNEVPPESAFSLSAR